MEKYITGSSFRDRCSIVIDRICNIKYDIPEELLDTKSWKGNDIIYYERPLDNNWIFCHPEFFDYLDYLDIDLSNKILFTHRSDAVIQSWNGTIAELTLGPQIKYSRSNLNPLKWFAMNSNCDTVENLPIGIPEQRHGKMHLIHKLNNKSIDKEYLTYLNFNPNSNADRLECIKYTKLHNHYNPSVLTTDLDEAAEYNYLLDLKKSYFVLSPNGFGIDCHRHWESIQMGAIPIVTRSKLVERFSKYFPFYIIDNWKDFDASVFTPELYNKLWTSFDKRYLDVDYYIQTLINNN